MGFYCYYYNDKYPEEASNIEILSELLSGVENVLFRYQQ